jgi:ferrous iron transport protein B
MPPADVALAKESDAVQTTLLVGNPNVGKSVIFAALTGRYATVSNYPGTTVEVCRGERRGAGEVIDLPGTNSLMPASEDERVTRDILLARVGGGHADVIQVCDAKNLRRGMLITLELAELEMPMVLVANMLDEARSRGIRLDVDKLQDALSVEVVATVATRRQGLGPLLRRTLEPRPCRLQVRYDEPIERAIECVRALLPDHLGGTRGIAIMLLCGDPSLFAWAREMLGPALAPIRAIQVELQRSLPEPVRYTIGRTRVAAADRLVAQVLSQRAPPRQKWARLFGDLAMHPFWGIPIAALVLYLVYLLVGVLGAGTAVDFLESTVFEGYLTPWLDTALRFYLSGFAEEFFVGPEGGSGTGLLIGDYGLISMALSYSVAIVLPIVGFFFVAFSIMEDSGYLPRLAVVLHRLFKVMGLNGKAVLPMILGLGCDTMATMTTRILATAKERLLVTLLLALGVPCSAQLGVILGMVAGLDLWATLTWLSAVLGVMVAVGFVANRVLPGQAGDFVLEVPPIRRPQLGNIIIKTVARIEWYLKEAVPLFILGTLVLWVLDRLAVLAVLQRFAAPLVEHFLGLPTEATDAFLIGFLRRDYGAAGLYAIFHDRLAGGNAGSETQIQVVVAMVTITLFVPCIANVFMIIKERGLKSALLMTTFIFPFAFGVGGLVNLGLRAVLL